MEEERAIRFVPFNGSTEEYKIWSVKHLAYASVKGYEDIYTESYDENKMSSEEILSLEKMNKMG